MSTSKRRPEDDVWFVHAPLKKEQRDVVYAPPPSMIPYLNGVMDTDDDMAKKQTIWFRETDSEFVKLSKMGGRQDLLIHKTKAPKQGPEPYPRPEWWVDMLTETGEKPKDEKKPYTFEVPAWFAHQHKRQVLDEEKITSINYPYSVSQDKSFPFKDAIQEPPKYGQLRNYLNPVKVKTSKNVAKNDNLQNLVNISNHASKHSIDPTVMSKLIGNSYQNERPQNYQEWKAKNN